MAKGNKYGAHRVIEPKGLLPQAAQKKLITRWKFTTMKFSSTLPH